MDPLGGFNQLKRYMSIRKEQLNLISSANDVKVTLPIGTKPEVVPSKKIKIDDSQDHASEDAEQDWDPDQGEFLHKWESFSLPNDECELGRPFSMRVSM